MMPPSLLFEVPDPLLQPGLLPLQRQDVSFASLPKGAGLVGVEPGSGDLLEELPDVVVLDREPRLELLEIGRLLLSNLDLGGVLGDPVSRRRLLPVGFVPVRLLQEFLLLFFRFLFVLLGSCPVRLRLGPPIGLCTRLWRRLLEGFTRLSSSPALGFDLDRKSVV